MVKTIIIGNPSAGMNLFISEAMIIMSTQSKSDITLFNPTIEEPRSGITAEEFALVMLPVNESQCFIEEDIPDKDFYYIPKSIVRKDQFKPNGTIKNIRNNLPKRYRPNY